MPVTTVLHIEVGTSRLAIGLAVVRVIKKRRNAIGLIISGVKSCRGAKWVVGGVYGVKR